MRKFVLLLAGLFALSVVVYAVEVVFWTAPNPTQEAFWRSMAEAYMAEHPDVKITVQAIVEGPQGSEGTILAAIAGGNAPTASENIFTGFGAQLVEAGAVVPLNELPGWDELIVARRMTNAIKGWVFGDGNYYIFPIYANAMLFAWRLDILKELGFGEPPATYEGILAVGKKLKEMYPDKFLWARTALVQPTWWQRWFDFFMLYNAASDGNPFLSGGKLVADDEAVITVFKFLQELNAAELLLTQPAENPFQTGLSIWTNFGPWGIPWMKENFPELKFGENLVFAPPPVPASFGYVKPHKTFADAKGIVIYAPHASGASQEQINAIWEFVKWVFGSVENDVAWFKQTNLLPLREDLTTNPAFAAVFAETPELIPYAEELPYAVPPLKTPKVQDIQTALSEYGMIPALLGQKTPEQAWEDAKREILLLLEE
jgi:multiple sugar transport system substrate-binding protein